jgi:hypothetical protein
VMSVDPYVERFRDDPWGQALIREGQAEGREQGQAEGREQVLLAVLRARFGDGPEVEQAVRMLVGWADVDAALAVITAAPDSETLLHQLPRPR